MVHMPVNHPLRPLYRTLAALCGLYVFAFGVVALTEAGGHPFFAQEGLPWVLGLRANRAFAVLSIVAGTVLVGGAVIGRNVDRWINMVGGVVFLGAGMAMMSVLRTDLNYLGFTMTTCIISFIIGLVLLLAGLYGRVGSRQEEEDQESFRHRVGPAPTQPVGERSDRSGS